MSLSSDFYIDDNDYILSGQTDNSEIHWYYQSSADQPFVEYTAPPYDTGKQMFVPPGILQQIGSGAVWKVTIIPLDSFGEFGVPVTSPSVIILPS